MDNHVELTTTGAGDGPSVSMAGGTYRIVITGKETNGMYAVIDMLVPPGGGPGPHAHAAIQESFYVLEGDIEVKTETGTYTATKGSFVNIPLGGMVHCFKNKSDKMAHLLCTVLPAGMENMFLEIGTPVEAGKFIPPQQPDAAMLEKMKSIAEKYGQKLYPPDYLG
jgi:quercetin dioxygenase-like cupin family protein